MKVITYPKAYQSAFRDACFVLDGLSAADGPDIGIYSALGTEPVGVKRLYARGEASVNAAPYVRSQLSPQPLCGKTFGVYSDAGRAVSCHIAASDYTSAAVYLTAGTEDAPTGSILSDIPSAMKIRPGEKDEISMITAGNTLSPAIIFSYDGGEYTTPSLAMTSRTDMMTLVVDVDAIGIYFSSLTGADSAEMTDFTVLMRMSTGLVDTYSSRRYVVDRAGTGGCRLAWINCYGALDYYTYPYRTGVKSSGNRKRIYTPDGYRTVSTSAEKAEELLSDIVDGATVDWLAGVFSSPCVWKIEGATIEQVEIAAGSAKYSALRPGTVSVSVSPVKRTVSRKF